MRTIIAIVLAAVACHAQAQTIPDPIFSKESLRQMERSYYQRNHPRVVPYTREIFNPFKYDGLPDTITSLNIHDATMWMKSLGRPECTKWADMLKRQADLHGANAENARAIIHIAARSECI